MSREQGLGALLKITLNERSLGLLRGHVAIVLVGVVELLLLPILLFVVEELPALHFLLQDVSFEVETVLDLPQVQVDFKLNFDGSLDLLNFLVKFEGLLFLDLVL